MLQNITSKRLNLLVLLIFIFFASLSLKILFDAPGWPMNHENNTFFIRTLIQAQHYSFSDFFPIYSSLDNKGLGSPYPAFYHKLFYAVSATFFLVCSDIKIATVATILFFLVIGAFGIFSVLCYLKLSKVTALAGGIFLITANYTITNWLIRGAMAELSAMMITPWVIYYFLQSLDEKKITFGLGISSALLFLAHSVLGLYVILTFMIATLFSQKITDLKLFFNKFSALAIAAFLAISFPNFFAIYSFSEEFNLSWITSTSYNPQSQMYPLSDYFFSLNKWKFGENFYNITRQIDAVFLIMLVIGLAAYFFNRKATQNLKILSPFFISLIFCLWLLTPFALGFYEFFPGAKFIQFPWRLLAIITPLFIIISLFLLENFLNKKTSEVLILCSVLCAVLLCGSLIKLRYRSILVSNDLADYGKVSFNAFGEYVPRSLAGNELLTYEEIEKRNSQLGCKTISQPLNAEVKKITFEFECEKNAQIILPFFITKFHKISKPCQKNDGWCEISLPKGASAVDVDIPNFFSLFNKI